LALRCPEVASDDNDAQRRTHWASKSSRTTLLEANLKNGTLVAFADATSVGFLSEVLLLIDWIEQLQL